MRRLPPFAFRVQVVVWPDQLPDGLAPLGWRGICWFGLVSLLLGPVPKLFLWPAAKLTL